MLGLEIAARGHRLLVLQAERCRLSPHRVKIALEPACVLQCLVGVSSVEDVLEAAEQTDDGAVRVAGPVVA